jgi:hypothetical protein
VEATFPLDFIWHEPFVDEQNAVLRHYIAMVDVQPKHWLCSIELAIFFLQWHAVRTKWLA